jgi:predicted DNA-binding transcriptional regulator AlpA
MENYKLIRLEEVTQITGISGQTINNWYRFAKQNPNNEYAKMLPPVIQQGARQTRYWKEDTIGQLIEFQRKIPKGRNGILGDVTQKSQRAKKNGTSNDYIFEIDKILRSHRVDPSVIDEVKRILMQAVEAKEK